MIDGCLEWQGRGLQPPEAVRSATTAYFEAEDAIGAWIDDRCIRDEQAWEFSQSLFSSWSAWAEEAEGHVGSLKRFVQLLEARGFTPQRRRDGRGFVGLKVRI